MKAILSFLKSQVVANVVGLVLGCIAGILLSFPYWTSLVLPFGLVQLPSLVTMVTTGIPSSDYAMWPHWVPLFHLLAVSLYYSLAILGYGYCGFAAVKRTSSVRRGLGAALWATVVMTGTAAVTMCVGLLIPSAWAGFGFPGFGFLGGAFLTCLSVALLMGMSSTLVAAFSGAIGSMIGSMQLGNGTARASREVR